MFFNLADDKDCDECDDILEELEIIDGEADLFGNIYIPHLRLVNIYCA